MVLGGSVRSRISFKRTQSTFGFNKQLVVSEPARSQFSRLHGCLNANQEAFKLRQELLVLATAPLDCAFDRKTPAWAASCRLARNSVVDRRIPDQVDMD